MRGLPLWATASCTSGTASPLAKAAVDAMLCNAAWTALLALAFAVGETCLVIPDSPDRAGWRLFKLARC
jgi:hypothetical protein